MRLRELLDVCQDSHSDDWVRVPGSRPATAMLAGMFDPGMEDARTRPLAGHSIAVFEPDPQVSMVWPVPDEAEAERPNRHERFIPEWAEQDGHGWKNARPGFVVFLLGGAPVWQELVWYLDWGSGIGGYVPNIEAVFGDDYVDGEKPVIGWSTTAWAASLTRLISSFESAHDWYTHDPTLRIVPKPESLHPVDAALAGR